MRYPPREVDLGEETAEPVSTWRDVLHSLSALLRKQGSFLTGDSEVK